MANPIIREEGDYLVVESTELNMLLPIRNKLRTQRIRDSFRKILLRKLNSDSMSFDLHKQAAFAGRIHCVMDSEQEDHLGPISIKIRDDTEKLMEIIDWLTSVDFRAD